MFERQGLGSEDAVEKVSEEIDNGTLTEINELLESPEFVNFLFENKGYDGVDTGGNLLVFDVRKDVKSATDNEGTFDPKNPSIKKGGIMSFLFMRKSDYTSKLQMLKERRGDATQEDTLEYFRKLLLDHLETLEKKKGRGEAVHKSLLLIMEKDGKGLPVGTIREWNGRKFIKTAPGKWRPKYDGESRGAKAAVAAIKRKVDAAKTARELMDIVMENRDRFSHMADTPNFMKDLGLTGDYFSVRYGVVSRHEGKDADHNLTERNWIDLTEAITRPFAIAKHDGGYRLFTDVKINGKFIAVG